MGYLRRIILFFAINALVILTISVILSFFHVQPFLQSHGISYRDLLLFCTIWGFGGAFISLGLSRMMAKWMMGVKVIDPNTRDPQGKDLIHVVYTLARAANLPAMPEVGIYESPEINAFATGPSRRRSLVAVSRGLLNRMSQDELEGVLGHEIAHVANGDMVTMTLMQGVINAFVMFLARVLAFALSGIGNKNNQRSSSGSYGTYYVLVFVFELVFMLLGMLVIAAYSRYREFRADRGGAKLAGKGNMISALEALKRTQEIVDERAQKPAYQSFKISNPKRHGIKQLFSTHPPLEVRIERLKQA
jgi:heat shock protein HtpX